MAEKLKYLFEKKTIIVLICIAASSVSFFFESSSPFLKGTDAYYYALQTDHWARTGHVKIPDSSPVHRITGLLQRAGLSTENSIRVFQAFLLFLTGFSVFIIPASSLNERVLIPLTLLFCISPSVIFTIMEFPKMFSFIFLVPLWFYFSSSDKGILITFITIFAAVFLHKAAIPLGGMFLLTIIIQRYFSKHINLRNIAFLLIITLTVSVLYFVFLSDSIGFADFSRISFRNYSPGYISLLSRKALPAAVKAELIITFVVYLSVIIFCFIKRKITKEIFLTFSLLIPGFFPFGVNESFSIGERYALMLPVFFVISLIFILKTADFTVIKKAERIYILLLILPLIFYARLEVAHPDRLDPDNKEFDRITEDIKRYEIPMLIAHRGMNFYYKYKLKREAFLYEPEDHWNKKKIFRLIYKITDDELIYYLGENPWTDNLIKPTGSKDYHLIREDCWVAFRNKVKEEDNQDLHNRIWNTWLNPSKKRPAFLYKKHKTDGLYHDDEGEFPALPPDK